jgi:5-methylcytosine-specific restriction endonuclease McrA
MSSRAKSQVREAFRCAVFKRDGYKCVFCNITEHLDAHHIINRNLMPDGGYVLDNGVTLCELHHLMAEMGDIAANEIRKKIGVPMARLGVLR